MQFEVVQRTSKRKREDVAPSSSAGEVSKVVKKRGFNTTTRCSLKELKFCTGLLKDRHLLLLDDGGLGHIKDFKIKGNINRRLMGFLLYKIDPETMILDLGDGNKILQITADGIEKLFGLPRGKNSPPRPSDNGHDSALMALKGELGIPRNKHIHTKDLRKLLIANLADPANDAKSMKVFGLILYNKFICPGYSTRVAREAPMVENFDIAKLKDADLCQLVVDELKKAVIDWQKSSSEWMAIPGCGIAPLLMYLDCIDHRKLNGMDKRTPRILYFNEENLRKLARLDIIKKGNKKPSTWVYGKLPVRQF